MCSFFLKAKPGDVSIPESQYTKRSSFYAVASSSFGLYFAMQLLVRARSVYASPSIGMLLPLEIQDSIHILDMFLKIFLEILKCQFMRRNSHTFRSKPPNHIDIASCLEKRR